MNNKIGAKDLITLGIFTVIYFVIGAALSLLISIPIMVPFFPAVWALINGTVFMLYSTKVEKFGLVTLMAVLTLWGSRAWAFGVFQPAWYLGCLAILS